MASLATTDFKAFLDDLYGALVASDRVGKIRAKAWDRYQALGLPTKRSEVFRYVPLRTLYGSRYSPVQSGFEVSGGDDKVVIMPLDKAMATYGTFLSNRWTKTLKSERDPFAALNGALHHEGIFIYVPPKVVVSEPIVLRCLMQAGQKMAPRVHLFVGAQSQVDLSLQVEANGDDFWMNSLIDCAIEEGGRARVGGFFGPLSGGWVTNAMRATLKRDSRLDVWNIDQGGKVLRHDYAVTLVGENAEVELNGACALHDKAQSHTNVHIEHVAPHCRSSQLFKSLLSGYSRASFEGMIDVEREAQKTDAFQLNNNLILSDHAIANSKPVLEIRADDVKASHGATVGQLDPELLFYLESRGIAKNRAKSLLIEGFLGEVIDQIPMPDLRMKATAMIKSYLK